MKKNKTTKQVYKKEVEICGEKVIAEYFVSDDNYCSLKKKYKLLCLWDKITIPYYRMKIKIKDIYWEIRYAVQRVYKGYDSVDVFEMYSMFIDRYYKILTRYKETMHGYPGTMSEKEWNDIIDKMLMHLYYMDENNIKKELYKDIPENWILSLNTVDSIMEKHKNEFFKLFSEYFYCLWD